MALKKSDSISSLKKIGIEQQEISIKKNYSNFLIYNSELLGKTKIRMMPKIIG